MTRSPAKLADFDRRGVTVRYGDLEDPEGLVETFAGVDRLLLISIDANPLHTYLEDPDPLGSVDGRRVTLQIGAVKAAERAGVSHIVYTSAPNPEPPTCCFWKRDHFRTEIAIRDSGLSWSILRNWEYPDFHLTWNWAQAVGTGQYVAGSGAGRCAFISREDCALAAAAALASDSTKSRIYDITGSQVLTIDEVISLLSEVNDRPIQVIQVSPTEFRQHLTDRGEDLAPVFAAFHEGVSEGKYDRVSSDFEELTGHRPTSLEEFLRAHPVTAEQTKAMFRFADFA